MGSRAHTMTSAAYRAGQESWDELVVHRDLSLSKASVEVRADAMGKPRFYGHAAVFNERTAIGNPLTWGFYEQIAPGAFSKTLMESDARMLIDHDSYYIVSRASAGTLLLSQDAQGLVVDSAMDDSLSYVRDLEANLRNGNLTGMSFGFQVTNDDWTDEPATGADGQPMVDPDGNAVDCPVRTIREVKLIEVSAVTFPAYEQTDAGLRQSLVVALRRRGSQDAIARTLRYKPDLAGELLPATVIDLKPVGELLGNDTPIVADAGAMEPFEERDPKKPYGDVAYADPGYQDDGVSRYPIDTAAHAKAAWSYINQADNASKYTSSQLASIKSKIKAACKKFGVQIDDTKSSDPTDTPTDNEPAETTREPDGEHGTSDVTEPAESTRRPLRRELAQAQLRALSARLGRPAA